MERVATFDLMGRTQGKIAEALGLSLDQVRGDLGAIRKLWLERAVESFDERKSKELARFDLIEREAWERSCHSADKRDSERTRSGRTNQSGDARFLAEVRACIDMRCKILGFYAPVKVAPTNPEGTGPATIKIDPSKLTLDQQRMLIAIRRLHGQIATGRADNPN